MPPPTPHDPPAFVNDRARDVVDLLLLRTSIETIWHPSPAEIVAAKLEVACEPVCCPLRGRPIAFGMFCELAAITAGSTI